MTTISGDTGVDKFEGTTIAGHVIQVANYTTGNEVSGTALIPYDNTIPQITEGTQFMSLAFTPKKANSKLKITVHGAFKSSVVGAFVTTLFVSDSQDALVASSSYCQTSLTFTNISYNYVHTISSVSPIMFSVRGSTAVAGTLTIGSSVTFGGSLASSITIEEIAQ